MYDTNKIVRGYKMNKELFSNQEVNTSRQIEMDLAKGFAILLGLSSKVCKFF